MDDRDRKSIQDNLEQLISVTEWNPILETFVIRHATFRKMIINIRACVNDGEKKRKFYEGIQKRGPTAFNLLLESLFDSGNHEAVKILDAQFLQGKLAQPQQRNDGKVWNKAFFQNPNEKPDPMPDIDVRDRLRVRVKPAIKYLASSNSYNMSSKPRGHVLIIDNEEFDNNVYSKREGSSVDSENLDLLFQGLGFSVEIRQNLASQQMRAEIQRFSNKADHGDMSVLIILSHGDKNLIFGSDGISIAKDWILKQFNNYFCPGLRGKPKLFIYQACRGDEPDYGCVQSDGTPRTETDAGPISPVVKDPTFEDMLIANATIDGYVANRDKFCGTWYIESICEIFMNHACDHDIRDMLDLVSQKVRSYESGFGTKQSCSYENIHFYKKLYFNPGIYLDTSSSLESNMTSAFEELQLPVTPSGTRMQVGNFFPAEKTENLMCEIELQVPN